MGNTRLSTIVRTEFHVVTTRGIIARTFNREDDAVMFQTRNPGWSIFKVETTAKDITPSEVITLRLAS